MFETTNDPERRSDDQLIGPFTTRRSGVNGYEIVDANGTTSLWAYGEAKAASVVRGLNFAYEEGQL